MTTTGNNKLAVKMSSK